MKNIYTLILFLLALTAIVKAQVSEQEFQALKALYNSTGGDNWTNRTGWENINTTATKNDVTTAWNGIRSIIDGHITEIFYYNNNLAGSLPPEIGELKWLVDLAIYNNKLSGQIPSEIGVITSLVSCNLNSNQLTSPLPNSLGNLINLVNISLSNNYLDIPFPVAIFQNLTKLGYVYLDGCGFSGTLPSNFFSNFPDLGYLDLSQNKLEGVFPSSISQLKKIGSISISTNKFTGNLPSLDSCKSLSTFAANNNDFIGLIPASWSTIPLKYIYLSENELSGQIPVGLFSATLQRLYIDQNYFTFDGLEPVFNKINALSQKYYSTDKTFVLIQNTLSVNAGEQLSLNASTLSSYALGGNNNRYKWFRNNVEVYSGNNPIYSVTSASIAHAGVYRFEVTNTVVTGVTLKSDNLTVSIIGSNQTPTNITLSSSSVNENFTGLIGTLSATDTDTGDAHTFSLATGNGTNDKDNGKFRITGDQLRLYSEANFESTTTLNILVSVNDGNGGIFTKAFVLTVNNVNEAPFYSGQLTSKTIDENAANGYLVLNLTAVDPEGSPVTYTITGGNENGAFGINGNKLVVADYSKFNYDVKKSYSLIVAASDGNLSSNNTLTVNLNKINRMPEVQNATFNINENSPVGTAVGSIVATDREGDPLVISITGGNASGSFSVTGKNITIANPAALNYETSPVFTLTINVSDGVSNVQATVTINLINVVEPTDNAFITFTVPGMVGEPVIDLTAHTVRAYVRGVNLNMLNAVFTFSSNATSTPISGSIFDFTTPQTITVTSLSGIKQNWVVTVTFPTANNELGNPAIKLHPNPASDFLTVSGVEAGSKLKIVSLTGQILFQKVTMENVELLDLRNLNPGNYLVVIGSTDKPIIQKLIKK